MMITRFKRHRIVIFGDSLTQRGFELINGYSAWAHLSNYYRDHCDVVIRGFSGYNTEHARMLSRSIANELDDECTLAVFVWFGANDASCGQQRVPIEQYNNNVKSIIEIFKTIQTSIVIVSPPPMNEKQWAVTSMLNTNDSIVHTRFNRITSDYAKELRRIASSEQVHFIDLFTKMNADLDQKFTDGLHLNDIGYRQCTDIFIEFLKENKLDPDSLPRLFPYWKTVLPPSLLLE
ncbi:hypothetical protein CANCADRAFT_30351 [Tortispora caseinolytica NRRL Y-17796]|uniref:SGNH hydrolase-type esterase domain-containing protein n=1 Tax=Tortispora caseinolytica NRRL Y-17796 TaxID=767744 RepID=A0A1E4TK39_9ASCO|nr:hypothetical protein CANCADRAFT_30351 [Tortispora caseinolytica NRRL Y-17796]